MNYIYFLLASLLTAQRCRLRPTSSATPAPQKTISPNTSNQPQASQNTQNSKKQFSQPQAASQAPPSSGNIIDISGIRVSPTLIGDAIGSLNVAVPKVPLPHTGNFAADALQLHNAYRLLVNQPPLKYSNSIQTSAQNYANLLASRDAFEHSHTPGLGENLYQSTNSDDTTSNPAIKAWMDEFPLYGGEGIGQGNFEAYGHFTQLIWPTTTDVGCGHTRYTTSNGSKKQVTVCQYSPPGNFEGEGLHYSVNKGVFK